MKKLIVFLAFIISTHFGIAQSNDGNAPLSKKERKKEMKEKQYQMIKEMIQNKSFVLEADFLQDKYGKRVPVNNGINFVSIDSTEAIIQIGSDYGLGPNGVGGVTARGNISNWTLKEHKKSNSYGLRLNVMTSIGIYDLYLTISPSGMATAELTGLTRGSLTFDGHIVSLENSSVFVGRSL